MFGFFTHRLRKNKYFRAAHQTTTRVLQQSLSYPQLFENTYSRIMVCAPHPDDESIGLGGFLLKYKSNIASVFIFTNRDDLTRRTEALGCQALLNIKFEMPSASLGIFLSEAKIIIKNAIATYQPDLICTTSMLENHPDHYSLFKATIQAIAESNSTSDVALYEVWNTLFPNYIVDISDFIHEKNKLISTYQSQMATFDYIQFSNALNKYRGMQVNVKFGEGLMLISNNRIKELL